jgi:hypothetical protein
MLKILDAKTAIVSTFTCIKLINGTATHFAVLIHQSVFYVFSNVVLPLLSVARPQKMYLQATAVRTVVKVTETTLTPLLSSMFIPEILVTVGPSTPTT